MAKTFTYTFGAPSGDISITTADDPSQISGPDGGTYSGYVITDIRGTFYGEQISGLRDTGGQYREDSIYSGEFPSNAIFVNSSQGANGSSFYGIDAGGIAFNTTTGNSYFIYQNSQNNFYAVDMNGYNISDTTPTSTNYDTVTCFVTGCQIRVVRDDKTIDVAVEDLRVGDLAVTASGAHRPIRWIGSRLTDCRHHPHPEQAMPVRIRAGALGENRPARDLLVSPAHAICLDVVGEVLIPAAALVNGSSIVQEDVDSVTYWHVELDGHDILLAEGQPAESYLDMGNRAFFGDLQVVGLSASPDGDPLLRTHADFCRPFHAGGALVEVVRSQARLRAQALGWTLATPEAWADVHLEVDGAIVLPKTRGLTASFVLPADARDVWLVCPTSIPRHVGENEDGRTLGLCLSGLTLTDGFGATKAIELDDPLLCVGFHGMSSGHRWTAGRARLPAALLEGLAGNVFLRVDLTNAGLPRWVAPKDAARVEIPNKAPRLRLVAA